MSNASTWMRHSLSPSISSCHATLSSSEFPVAPLLLMLFFSHETSCGTYTKKNECSFHLGSTNAGPKRICCVYVQHIKLLFSARTLLSPPQASFLLLSPSGSSLFLPFLLEKKEHKQHFFLPLVNSITKPLLVNWVTTTQSLEPLECRSPFVHDLSWYCWSLKIILQVCRVFLWAKSEWKFNRKNQHQRLERCALQRAMDLAQEKGASSWLRSLPLEEFGFSQGTFRDAIVLIWPVTIHHTLHPAVPVECHSQFTMLSSVSDNEVRNTTKLMAEICYDVCIELHLPERLWILH